jgi:hypothetical protein
VRPATADDYEACETCGKWTLLSVTCCGTCAADLNDPDPLGLRRVNRRREQHGLPPITREEPCRE